MTGLKEDEKNKRNRGIFTKGIRGVETYKNKEKSVQTISPLG